MGGSDRRVSGLGRHSRGRTTEQAAALFWQFSASIKSLQRKQCIIKKWSTQAYQKAYQIRPSPLRRNGRCRLQAQSVLQPCPTGEVRGRVSKAAKPGAEQPGATHSLQGEHGEDCEHPPFDTALGAAPQLNKPTSGRQARPPKGGSGALSARVFMYIKTYLATRFAGPDRTRCMATYKCALRENGRTLLL